MENSTYPYPSMLRMIGFGEMTAVKYLYSIIAFVGYVMIILSNVAVITAVALHRGLQEPMFIFICALCINGLYGSTAFFPSLIANLLSEIQTVSYIGCLTQVFCIHTYMGCELTLLAVMAFDRYVCICNPLRYNSIMSLTTVFKLVAAAWLYCIILFTIHFILTIRLPLCGSVIEKIYCDNWSVVKLSCINTAVNNIFGLFITAALIMLMPVLILYTYLQIIRVCVKASEDTRAKALQTCTPHLITLMNFVADVLFEILLHRFKSTILPYELRIVMSVQFLVVPPLLNPLIYGLKMKEIRVKIAKFLRPKSITAQSMNTRNVWAL
ncbi:olfactory receptor 52E4-like [Ascaphus truei]|uniref:olfactory receptor 52E4-like n=1 Tax=Ascaphus truei TaxID=8439 RepID=UPI003F5982F9